MTLSRPVILGIILCGLLALVIGMTVMPFLTLRRTPSSVGTVMRQLTLSCLVYANDNNGNWPATLEDARVYEFPNSQETVAEKARIRSFCYIRPSADAYSGQPVVLDDPASHPGKDMHVAYADGHIGLLRDLRIWEVACRLAASAKASGPGIDIGDWPNGLPGVEVPLVPIHPATNPPNPPAK